MVQGQSGEGMAAQGAGDSSANAGPRRGWTVHRDPSPGDPQRYTRFVTIMKRALLLAALALIAAVIAYMLQPRDKGRVAMTFEHLGALSGDLAMIKPRLTGKDGSGNPFTVTADEAVQDGTNARRATLKNVQADMTLDKGPWISASAKEGHLDADKRTLQLSGAISVFSDNGYELHTESAHVDLGKSIMTGNSEVTGHGPMGSLRADSFVLDRMNQTITLKGHVKTTFILHGDKS